MPTLARRAGSAWMRLTEPLLLRSASQRATASALRAARITRFPEWYLGMSYLTALLVGTGVWAAGAVYLGRGWTGVAISGGVGVGAFLMTRLAFLAYPRVVASGRARRIDAQLPSVVTLCYALARGGMDPLDIFRAVAKERKAYGEASVEFGVIAQHVEWFGLDLVSAMKETSATTPSRELKGLLEGLITILNSGAEPRDYFKDQAHTRLKQAELALERDLEQTSLLAEVYVSGLLVLPLLLLVVLSGLAPLAPGQDAIMPFIVFGMIPLGTAVYLILLETLLPPDELGIPTTEKPSRVDFGMHSLPARTPLLPPPWRASGSGANAIGAELAEAEKAARSLRWRLFFERIRARTSAAVKRWVASAVENPLNALEVSGFLGLAASAIMAWYAIQRPLSTSELTWAMTGAILLGGGIALVPVTIFHEVRVRRARHVDKALPGTLNRLAGFNERGISLLQSFMILGNTASGPLAHELRAVGNDVKWNASLTGALRRLRDRVRTQRMAKLGILLERASAATGNLREVLDIAADDATRGEHLRSTKHQSMMSYVVVIYLVFAVFVYVLYVVANLFYGPEGLGAASATGAAGSLDPVSAKMLFAQAAVLQGIGCGLVAGRLGEGHLASGFKHAMILAVSAYLIFHVGVL